MSDRPKSLSSMYREIRPDQFTPRMEITFSDATSSQTLIYEKVEWVVDEERRGLRYGENPDQEAALYKLVNGNLTLGETNCIRPGRFLASEPELLRSGKHPGKINITDADSALNILRYFQEKPCTVIIKHNNPCGVALGSTLAESYERAYLADRIAAFGGAVALNREVDRETAEAIAASYCEVVVAPEFAPGTVEILGARKNLRVMKIGNMKRLSEYVGTRVLDAKTLMDGGMVVQWSFAPRLFQPDELVPAAIDHRGTSYAINRPPTEREKQDMIFGWLVESGVTSNSVLFVKDGVTVGIGTGEQDRVGVAEIARDKAYRKAADRLAWQRHGKPLNEFAAGSDRRLEIEAEVEQAHGGIEGSVMISDGFFPFRDGVDVGLQEGASAVLQPGGSIRDYEAIEACNEHGATMAFTGQRSFRH